MAGRWYNIQHPEIYQGQRKKKQYFEGWYYKIVHPSGDHAFALIPGVSIESETERHAFIQLMDGTGGKSHYYTFDYEDFEAHPTELQVRIGHNTFSKSEINIDLPDIKGRLAISDLTPLDRSILSPGIMGWYSYTPMMQCYHGIVSMHHHVNGSISHGGKEWNYQDGTGYIEKDWGSSFPKCWFWTQCNTFEHEDKVSVFASVAHIPWMGNYFVGYIAAVQIGDELHRFATYNGARFQTRIEGDSVILQFKKGNKILSVRSTKGIGADLKSPLSGKMTGKVNESLTATMLVRLTDGDEAILIAEGTNAGLEVAGDYDVLLRSKF